MVARLRQAPHIGVVGEEMGGDDHLLFGERGEEPRRRRLGLCRVAARNDVYMAAVVYTTSMKRLQIYIEQELDDALAVQALRERTSKAALIRRFVAERLGLGKARQPDPLDELVGAYDLEVEPGDIDKVVYEHGR
jgi:hypothetical protein